MPNGRALSEGCGAAIRANGSVSDQSKADKAAKLRSDGVGPSSLRSRAALPRSALRRQVLHRRHQHAHLLSSNLSRPIAEGRKHPLLRDAAAAQADGFRPCLRCRPEASPGTPAWHGTSSVVSRGLRLITDGALIDDGVDALADRLGVTARHMRRLFVQHLGATPVNVALTRRVHFAKKLLDETHLPISQVAFAAGFAACAASTAKCGGLFADAVAVALSRTSAR